MKRCKTCGGFLIGVSAATKCYGCRRPGPPVKLSVRLVEADQRIVADVAYVIEQMGDGK